MYDDDEPTIMSVCAKDMVRQSAVDEERFFFTESAARALAVLRVLRADLILPCLDVPDMCVWDFVGRIKKCWPWQRWALVCDALTEDEETRARTLGVSRIFYSMVDPVHLYDLAAVARRQSEKKIASRLTI